MGAKAWGTQIAVGNAAFHYRFAFFFRALNFAHHSWASFCAAAI